MFKFKKKTLLALALSVSMAFSLCGCKKEASDNTETATEIATNTDTSENSSDNSEDSEGQDTSTVMADPSTPEAISEQEAFDKWLWDAFEESATTDTLTLHYSIAHPENYDITPSEITFGEVDFSEAALAEDKADSEESIAQLSKFDYELLTYEQRFTYDILLDYLETDIEFYDYIYLYEPYAYTSGLHSNYPITMAEYKFYDKEDVDDYLGLLECTPEYFQAYLDFEVLKSEKGLFMPANCASEVIRQCSEFINTPESNLLIDTFNDRIGEVEGLSEEDIETYKQANYDAVMNYIIPTYENVIETFETLKDTGENDLGLCYLENGKDYYAFLLKNKVGTDKTPDEVVELLDEEISSLMTSFSTFALANYEDYMTYIENWDSLYGEFDTKETIQYFQEATKDRFPAIDQIDFTVEPVHESLQDIVSPAFYMIPPIDEYLNNSIYINIGTEEANSLWSTLAHEGIPGHMYQFVYYLSSDPEPIRTLLNFSGYQEGWATYVEYMAFEYYDEFLSDTYAEFEEVNAKLNMLVSARLEIGVNYEGWDLEKTEEYLSENGFDPSIAQQIMDYVIAEPVNYQMYCLGWLEIEELKEYAEAELGENFNEKDFHKVVLDAGPCQFYLLEDRVEEYVNSHK